jgi:hypothetical protein
LFVFATSNKGDKGNQLAKGGASARRKNAEDNPSKKRTRKRAAESQPDVAASTTVPEPQAQPESRLDVAASTIVPKPQPESQHDATAFTTLPEPQYESQRKVVGDADPAQSAREPDREPDATKEADDVLHEMKLEEDLREDGEGGGQIHQLVWVNTYEGVPVPTVFPGGPSDTQLFTPWDRYI